MKNTQIDLTEGPIFKKLMIFTLPILAGNIVTQFYNVADSMIVGQFIGSDALAAVAASNPSNNIINMLLIGFQAGSSVVVAQKVGANNREKLTDSVSTIASLTLFFALLLSVGGVLITKPLLTLLNTPQEIFSDSYYYMTILFIGVIGNLGYHVGVGVLRGLGDSTWPFFFLCCCSLLNVVLDLLAVVVLGIGVPGVAAATAISQFVSGIGIVIRLNRGGYGVNLSLRGLHIDKGEAILLSAIAMPAAIQNAGNSIAALCVQGFTNSFGADFVAANSIVNKIENFAYIPTVSLGAALCTYVGQNIGKRKIDRVNQGINLSMASLVGLGSVICVIMLALKSILPLAFTKEPEVIFMAAEGISVIAFVSIFHGIDRCLVDSMRGAGKSVVPMITAQFGAFSRIPLAYFLAVRTGNYRGIFYAMALASACRTLAIAVYYFGGGWKRAVKAIQAKQNF